jgi:hypothetical protein
MTKNHNLDLNPNSVVYFVRREVDGLVKIGTSINVNRRMSWLANGAGPVTLLGTVPGGFDRENHIHRVFHDSREHGEWFRPTPELLAYIADPPPQRSRAEVAADAIDALILSPPQPKELPHATP